VSCRTGTGEAYIGDFVHSFTGPAAFFIAPNVPHSIVSQGIFDGWIIQIPRLILERFDARPEFTFLREFLHRTSPALIFAEESSLSISTSLEKAQEESGIFRWFRVLEVLYIASQDKKAHQSCLFHFLKDKPGTSSAEDKIEEIINNLFNELEHPHKLSDLAIHAGMSVQSFCRNFKKRMGMSYVEYVHSIRINVAKKLLQQSRMYVDDISYECGFNTVSFFNRKFKEYTGMTPCQYRRQFGGEQPKSAPAAFGHQGR
jgi:AraC-like DNA-binding protein